MPLNRISTPKVSDLVIDQIKKLIADREWVPGSKIPSENDIAKQLSVSRVSVRSALQTLSALGIVESRHGEGTFVCTYNGHAQINQIMPFALLTEPDQDAINELRIILEGNSAKLAAIRRTDEDISKLKENCERLESLVKRGVNSIEEDMEFHLLIAEASHNDYIVCVIDVLKEIIHSTIEINKKAIGPDKAVDFHRRILEKVIQRDADGAAEEMIAHMRSNRNNMSKLENIPVIV